MNDMSPDEKIVRDHFDTVTKYHFPDPPIDLSQGIETAYSRTTINAILTPDLWEKLEAAGWGDEIECPPTINEGYVVANGVLYCDCFHRASEENDWKFPTVEEKRKQVIKLLRDFVDYFCMHIDAHQGEKK